MLLVCIGDSLTFGYGVNSENCWVSLLNNSIDLKIKNKGVNGNTTAAMLDRFYDDVILQKASHVIILGGTNDFILNLKEQYVLENIKLMCAEAIKNKITPILASPIPVERYLASKCWSSTLNYFDINKHLYSLSQSLRQLSIDKNLIMADLFSSYVSFSSNSSLYTDGIHPNELGHKLIKDTFLSCLKS
ncbi:GDSL-type esterase/lipase family protein [Clostridium oryzae]|uniref:Multifunctional acyl-CoA thioesterase I and protease I and lysophospholipase L1 n=1 Tax=Clostridium oryzae TaxID=1450648 RepID=A0A1V4ISN7_9CLOT|nr:GDSL-type esterase/lipase family protein [Clostridium oryzae]OPJ63038.1 multifunctional acyl-CoA thioesterase I and protease I and lysophospholipase L1 [Clostridium oryzae]